MTLSLQNQTEYGEDATLAMRVAQGDDEAEQQLVQRYYPRVVRQAQHDKVPHPDYEDLAQEAVLALIEQLRRGAFREEAAFHTWAYRLAANKISDYWRRQQRDEPLLPPARDSAGDGLDAVAEQSLAAWLDSDLYLDVRHALATLEPHHRLLLILHRHYGFSAEEISRLAINLNQWNWSKKQIANRLTCAQEKFRRALPAYEHRTRKPTSPATVHSALAPVLFNERKEAHGKFNPTRPARYAALCCAGAQRLLDRLLLWPRHPGGARTSRSALADV